VFELDQYLPIEAYLEELQTHLPNDVRLEIYQHLQAAVAKIDPFLFLTITFSVKVTDEVSCELICQRITDQLQKMVIGKHKNSKIPCFTVLERSKSGSLHVHILIGRVQGKTRTLEDTNLKSYIRKKPFAAIVKILNRLTFPTKKGKPGKIGISDIKTVYSKAGAIDYVLKALKPNQLNIAWLATNIDFSDSVLSVRPQRPDCPNENEREP
jgi:hypothetical protein